MTDRQSNREEWRPEGDESALPLPLERLSTSLLWAAAQREMIADLDNIVSSNSFVETELCAKIKNIGEHTQSDVVSIIAPMQHGVDELLRDALDELTDKKENVLVILETDGGSIEVVERIADLLRHHYPKEVSFIIPSHAMSAGTVLAMSGDNILMDYFSILGPIDPQVISRSKGDVWVPALGYLEKYKDLLAKATAGTITDVEIAFFIAKFDPAELHQFEQARDLSIELLKKWLVKYKFKNWTVTRSSNKKVTLQMKTARADAIATKLNDVRRWKSHGRGLSMRVIDAELNLLINDFGADATLNARLRSYYRLLQDYMLRVRQTVVIHTAQKYRGL